MTTTRPTPAAWELVNVDRQIIDWLERKNTLHGNVETLYVVDGYQVELTRDHHVVAGPYHAATLRAALILAMDANP